MSEPNLMDPEVLEALVVAGLKNNDLKCVESALMVLAAVDPHRAEYLRDLMLFACDMAKVER